MNVPEEKRGRATREDSAATTNVRQNDSPVLLNVESPPRTVKKSKTDKCPRCGAEKRAVRSHAGGKWLSWVVCARCGWSSVAQYEFNFIADL